ncbi:MAG: sigma-54 dependent transcriptional regulator, partial [Bacteroidota bacterium]
RGWRAFAQRHVWLGRCSGNARRGRFQPRSAHGFVDIAVKSLKQGATDFLEKPFANDKLISTVQAALQLSSSHQAVVSMDEGTVSPAQQISKSVSYVTGQSEVMSKIHDTIRKIADTDAPVLITGEHGTGKELIARMIHRQSGRVAGPFVHVDLGATHETLFESILFGHVEGAYTDAGKGKAGLIETANLGTLFLDGIGELPKRQQAKLLTVLQRKEVMRIGEHQPRLVDFRLICASHHTPDQLANDQFLRQDLYFRINTVQLEIPALRHRIDDFKAFTDHFLQAFNTKYGKDLKLSRSATTAMREHSWPGNIRELENTIERMVILHEEGAEPLQILNRSQNEPVDNLYEVEKEKIAEIIARHAGNISRAAKELGIGRNTLYRKIKKYDL